MGNRYRCDECGCYLDPGEGRTCDECQEKTLHRAQTARRMRQAMVLNGNQYEMNMEEEQYESIGV